MSYPTLTCVLVQVMDELGEKGLRVVLDGVEADALQLELFGNVDAPVLDVFDDFGMVEVQVGEHQVVVVAMLGVDIGGPMLALALDLVEPGLLAGIVVVGGREVLPVVFLRRVLVTATGEIKA